METGVEVDKQATNWQSPGSYGSIVCFFGRYRYMTEDKSAICVTENEDLRELKPGHENSHVKAKWLYSSHEFFTILI